jgi:hypothetical protein
MSLRVVAAATLLALGFTAGLTPGKKPPLIDVDTATDDNNDDTVGFFTGLYNIDSDPDENTNLYDDDSYTDVLAEFVAKNDKWKDLVSSSFSI